MYNYEFIYFDKDNQKLLKLMIIFFILMTFTFNSRVTW